MDDFARRAIVNFRKIQGLTTLMAQQQAEFDALIGFFIDDIRMINPLITELIEVLDLTTHVFNMCYVVFLSNVQEFHVDPTS
jgi:hypothetical protein